MSECAVYERRTRAFSLIVANGSSSRTRILPYLPRQRRLNLDSQDLAALSDVTPR